jgi:hypothetical protein
MDLITDAKLVWAVDQDSIEDGINEFIDLPQGRTREDLFQRFNKPAQLTTPNLMIYMPPYYNADMEKVEFDTGSVVTPFQILGAIYTYYQMPVSIQELDRLRDLTGLGFDKYYQKLQRGEEVKRLDMLEGYVAFENLDVFDDGAYMLISDANLG